MTSLPPPLLLLATPPVPVPPVPPLPPLPEPTAAPAKRRRRWPAMAVVVLLLVLGGAITTAVVAEAYFDAVVQVRAGHQRPGADLPVGLRVQPTSRWSSVTSPSSRGGGFAEGDVYEDLARRSQPEPIRLAGVDGRSCGARRSTPARSGPSTSSTGTVLVAMVRGDDAVHRGLRRRRRQPAVVIDSLTAWTVPPRCPTTGVTWWAWSLASRAVVLTLSDGGELVWTGARTLWPWRAHPPSCATAPPSPSSIVATGDEHWRTVLDDAVVLVGGRRSWPAARRWWPTT